MLSYMCPGQWTVHASKMPSVIKEKEAKYFLADPDTCKPLYTREEDSKE
jgi:hypothetical protein